MKLKPRAQTAGFINGALIVGIALIGVVDDPLTFALSTPAGPAGGLKMEL